MATIEKRFDIEIPLGEAQLRFINRAHNFIDRLYTHLHDDDYRRLLLDEVCFALGKRAPDDYVTRLADEIPSDFWLTLKALEAVYASGARFQSGNWKQNIDEFIAELLGAAEIDLGIRWNGGEFIRRGAALLDEKLVYDPLHWLRAKNLKPVFDPFEKALRTLLEIHENKNLERLSDVVTDMYEALEAMAKIVTGRPESDLSANRELFIQRLGVSEEYKRLLKEYIDYAHRFRHAPSDKRPRPELSYAETESFVYMTGVFLRLAMSVG